MSWIRIKLLDELQSLNDKIKNEELLDKIDKFKQNSKNNTRNLEQLVELTKKYYKKKRLNS
jgi:ferritin-like metal-binding protein YciE